MTTGIIKNPVVDMWHGQLPELERTMTKMAAYLLNAPQKFPKEMLGAPDDDVLEMRSKIRFRVTQHWSAAMMTYGIPASEQELRDAIEWFATPFPRGAAHYEPVDVLEMTKLEGLLHLQADNPTVAPRLEQLLAQRVGDFFRVHRADAQEEVDSKVFDTLWALKLIMMARDGHQLDATLMPDADIKAALDAIMPIVSEKDLVVALRLYYELTGGLEAQHLDYLETLMVEAEAHHYMWGTSAQYIWDMMKEIVEIMHRRQLTPGAIESSREETFREMILNTCYVIENLAVLARDFDVVHEPLRRSMEVWWNQFKGEHAPANLRTLFPRPYDYLMVMTRTMIAVSAYIGEPLGARCWLPSLRTEAQEFDQTGWPDQVHVEKALRGWIDIRLGAHKALKLGLSDANVIRIEPALYNPAAQTDTPINLLNESLIVKYGPQAEIEKERHNYSLLPPELRDFFVRIPSASYTDMDTQRAFVIMQDLSHYKTLFEVFEWLKRSNYAGLAERLSDFLIDMHRGGGGKPVMANSNHFHDIYVLPMLQHVNQIDYYMQKKDPMFADYEQRFHEIEGRLRTLIAHLMQQHAKLSQFPLSYMHGDLHTRNIMILAYQRERRSRAGSNLHFKLIDLESLRPDGDAAHDAGQLLVDIGLLPISSDRTIGKDIMAKLDDLYVTIEAKYRDFARKRKDKTFDTRLELAKARALIRIAKGHAKRSERHVQQQEFKQALDLTQRSIHLIEGAIKHLENVNAAL